MAIEPQIPPFRKLRGYAFDPLLSLSIDTAGINDVVYKVDWEKLEPGPIGEYIEVIDHDPPSKTIYRPVNLDDSYILAMDGLDPSESNPQFHQQMVYAVAMTTIKNFEIALGRKIQWSEHIFENEKGEKKYDYVQRLRIYPHALREANAYYSPQKKALLFGYFNADPLDPTQYMPDGVVFTCLSHDIIAHEVTHAILDGIYPQFTDATNPDMLAFHEAFADIVALFQHFTFPEVLKHQIAKTRGNLESQNLLGELAQEFGKAIGMYGSLRAAIGEIDEKTGIWKPKQPTSQDYEKTKEPHARGSILVAAVFESFLNIYKRRIADLLRISTGGTGVLPDGELHPDLVNRLAMEAAKSAGHVLRMCIRALDYCPPIDLTFGDYLRAIITADVDLVADDNRDYRLAFIDAFRRRGIYPKNINTLSVESLAYGKVDISNPVLMQPFTILKEFLRKYSDAIHYISDRKEIHEIKKKFIAGTKGNQGLHQRLYVKFDGIIEFEAITGLSFNYNFRDFGVRPSKRKGYEDYPSFQVHSLHYVNRVGPNGKMISQVIITLLQHCGIEFDKSGDYQPKVILDDDKKEDNQMVFYGGCTLILDLENTSLKAISKPLLDLKGLKKYQEELDDSRIRTQYDFKYKNEAIEDYHLYFLKSNANAEPFAFLHRH